MDRKKSDLVTLKRTTNRPDKESYNIQFDADYDYLFKIVIVGDSSVGKSVLMQSVETEQMDIIIMIFIISELLLGYSIIPSGFSPFMFFGQLLLFNISQHYIMNYH